MNTKKTIASIVGIMLVATVLVMGVNAADKVREDYLGMPRMVYEFDAITDTGLYINDMGRPNEPTLRIYGEEGAIYPTHSYYNTIDFVYPDPVDPFDPGIIAKDSVTFNPAHMNNVVTVDGGATADDEKVFLRVFYEPGYAHDVDDLMVQTIYDALRGTIPFSMDDGALITETTYMLVNDSYIEHEHCSACDHESGHSGVPITGAVGMTRFVMPVNSVDSFDPIPGMDVDATVNLLDAKGDIGNVTNGMIEVGVSVTANVNDWVRFMDHEIKFLNCGDGINATFDVRYVGNKDLWEPAVKTIDVPFSGSKVYVTRWNKVSGTSDPAYRWFVYLASTDCSETCSIVVGRRLVAGETFYVDDARYDMPAIYVTDEDEFKYITLQSPIPKNPNGAIGDEIEDYSHVGCQRLAQLPAHETVWVLPPFNDDYRMIDDIDLVMVNEAGNIFNDDDIALDFSYIEEAVEGRFDSSLAERHYVKDGVQEWDWWNVFTKPNAYTTLVLPDQETTADQYIREAECMNCVLVYDPWINADGTEYLVTTSFIAPNSEGEEREELSKSSVKHDIVDRADLIAVSGDDSRDAYFWMPRMVFEYNAFDTDDFFVNGVPGDPTVRVYGEAGATYPTHTLEEVSTPEGIRALDFIYPDAVDPFDPGIIPKDSVTFNPAYLENEYGTDTPNEITVDDGNGDEKVFMRAFYEPEYGHAIDNKTSGTSRDPVYMADGALVIETTYMLLDDNDGSGHSGDPKAGAAKDAYGNPITYFMLPTEAKNLHDGVVAGMDKARIVGLEYASGMGTPDLTDGEIKVQRPMVMLTGGSAVKFMDHKVWFHVPTAPNYEIRLDIGYIGNMNEVEDRKKPQVVLEDTRYYVNRLNNLQTTGTTPDWRFYFEVTSMYYDGADWKAELTVGRHLAAGETFYVDGVRYDMPAIYVTDDDKFKYITFQSPLPKCEGALWYYDVNEDNQGDKSHVTCQWLANLLPNATVPVLPPFNEGHLMIDDIGLVETDCVTGNVSVEVAGVILGDVGELLFHYVDESVEERFSSSLAERHAYSGLDEIWNWWSIFTKPYQYTELWLPEQETTGMSDGNEYLITTSFIAPNCEGANRHTDDDCKPSDTHDIIDRVATLNKTGSAPTLMEGDVTLNDCVSITDAMFIAQNVTGARMLSADQMACADTDDDGDVDITDAMHIAQYVVDPDGTLGILFKPLWQSPADDGMLPPVKC